MMKIKDLLEHTVDNRGKTPPTTEKGHILMEINCITGNQKYPDYSMVKKYVSSETYTSWFRSGHPKKGDVLIPTVGTLNAIGFADRDGCCIAQNMIAFRANSKVCYGEYLYYLLCDPTVRKRLLQLDIGAVQPSIKVPHIKNLEVNIPCVKEQKKIAKILEDIDNKIATNIVINKNLEEQAQVIFAQYFIDIENIPDGWTEGNLTDIAEYLNGLAMQKFRPSNENESLPVLKIKELRQGICDTDSDRCSSEIKKAYIVHDGDVIFSWSGSLLVDFWCGGDCGLNQHLFKVTSEKYDKWFYYIWTNYHLQEFVKMAADRATTMGHIKRDALEKARVLIPNQEDYNYIGELLQPLYDSIIANRIENRKLAALRDTLLPRLMSGEIDVSSIEV